MKTGVHGAGLVAGFLTDLAVANRWTLAQRHSGSRYLCGSPVQGVGNGESTLNLDLDQCGLSCADITFGSAVSFSNMLPASSTQDRKCSLLQCGFP